MLDLRKILQKTIKFAILQHKTNKAMTLEINKIPVTFDKLPALEYIAYQDYFLYKLLDSKGNSVLRKVSGANIIQDLYKAIDVLKPQAFPLYFVEDLTAQEILAAKALRIEKPGHGSFASAWCYYDFNTRSLKALYPNRATCAKDLGISEIRANGCNQGHVSIIDGRIIVASHYISNTEMQSRFRIHLGLRPLCTRVYVYNYIGESEGSFMSIADAARQLKLCPDVIRSCIAQPDKMYKGHYFYSDPTKRPPVKLDKSVTKQ